MDDTQAIDLIDSNGWTVYPPSSACERWRVGREEGSRSYWGYGLTLRFAIASALAAKG